MVDLVLIETVSYIAGALGVLIAAIFYVLNLRENTRNRRITLTNTMMHPFMTIEGMKHYHDLSIMNWSDLEDYERKYDSSVNPDNFAKRMAMWNLCENFGMLYREGLIDLKTLDSGSSGMIQSLWHKFKPVIEMLRVTSYPSHFLENFEYVAGQLDDFHEEKH